MTDKLKIIMFVFIKIITLAFILSILMVICNEATATRPQAVDNSRLQYFPPIGGPQGAGDCTCWASAYYYNTYTQARDKGLNASTGDPNVTCSSRFLFALIAQGWWGAECTEHAMARLADVGCSNETLHPYGEPWNWEDMTRWPTEAAWVQALENRMGTLHKIRADNEDGLEEIKQHIADGGLVVTRADFLDNYGSYGYSASGPGIDNRVMYRRQGNHYLRHSICVVGYDDNRSYLDDRDGQIHNGSFLIANSEGQNWGWYNTAYPEDPDATRGYIWIAYTMFLEQEFGWYDYELETSPCFDNAPYPEVYYLDDRADYKPRLYAVAGINHNARNLLTFSGGIGPTNSPEFTGPEAIEQTCEGAIPINDSRRAAVDLTDGIGLIPPGETKNVFISLALNASASQPATITSADFYCDFNGDGIYTNVSASMGSPLTVWPGTTGYVSVMVTDLEGFFLNLNNFPMYLAQIINGYTVDQMCGPAVAQMTLNYMWWNNSQDPEPPMTFDDQLALYESGIENNTNTSLPYLDTVGLWHTIQYNKPMPYSTFGYNFMKYSNEDLNEILKRIVLWINYTVGTVGGHKEGHPLHVPSVVPAYGDYTNWMAVRGFRSNRSAYPMPDEITIYGFWVNDPLPGGLGENSYKTLNQWLSTYYLPLETDDIYDGEYVAILEPPELRDNIQLTIAHPPLKFEPEESRLFKFVYSSLIPIPKTITSKIDQLIVQAAIDGVTEQLLPYDEDFAAVFEQTYPGSPIFIKNLVEDKHDYYIVPFNIISKTKRIPLSSYTQAEEDITLAAVLIDAINGQFKEASWVYKPVNYLPLSETDALEIVFNELINFGYNPDELNVREIQTDLVYRNSTPYYPDWRVTINELGLEFFVSQNGMIST